MTEATFKKNNRLLVIDDNQAIHADFKKILLPPDEMAAELEAAGAALFGGAAPGPQSAAFELDSAFSGEDGLALVERALAEKRPYAMAFVDVRMAPGWDGIETTARIFAFDADIQIVICTAYSDYSWEEMIKKVGQSDRLVILKKPFDTVEVMQLAHALTEKWELKQKARAQMDQLERMVTERTHELHMANEQLKFEMAEHARAEEALRQAQKMEAVGQLAGGIAHDFNNLLTVIRGYVECLVSQVPSTPDVGEALREIDAAADRAAKLTSQLLMFSRKKRMQLESLNLNVVIAPLASLLRRLLGDNIAVEIETGIAPLFTRADPVMIEMVIMNLAVNARDAMPQGGRLTIRTGEMEIKPGERHADASARAGRFACISVQDTGCGIAPEVLPHLFEPFFTTKEIGKGTGLGLASVFGIVKQHAGWIEVQSEPGHGATFRIFLPVCGQPPGPANHASASAAVAGGQETILLVEDEHPLRRLARTVLQRRGYRVHEAASSAEALSLWNELGSSVQLLLTDMIMPGSMSGRELAEELLKKKSGLKIVYTSGYSADVTNATIKLEDGVNFLPKPYEPEKLLQTVRRCLDGNPVAAACG